MLNAKFEFELNEIVYVSSHRYNRIIQRFLDIDNNITYYKLSDCSAPFTVQTAKTIKKISDIKLNDYFNIFDINDLVYLLNKDYKLLKIFPTHTVFSGDKWDSYYINKVGVIDIELVSIHDSNKIVNIDYHLLLSEYAYYKETDTDSNDNIYFYVCGKSRW